MAKCENCGGSGKVRLPRATVTSLFYGDKRTVFNLPVPCPVCHPEAHEKPPGGQDPGASGEE